jgi:uncharacterized protein YcbX
VPTVARLSIAPVKSLGLQHPDEVVIGPDGVAENRRFYLVDERGRLYSGNRHGPLVQVVPAYDPERDWLSLRFPDGQVVEAAVEADGPVSTGFWGERIVRGQLVRGPWAEALSAYAGKPLRLVRAEGPPAFDVHPVTLVSDGSLAALAEHGGRDAVDARRFRMLIDLAGCEPHEEDTWIGGRVRIGEAVLRIPGPVPRCVVTTQNPETGVRDFDTLRTIKDYRGMREGKKLDFGVYGDIEQPGRVRVADPVEPL